MADHSPTTTTAMVFGAALVLVLAPVARAQDRMPPIPMSNMTEAQKEVAAAFEAERGCQRIEPQR